MAAEEVAPWLVKNEERLPPAVAPTEGGLETAPWVKKDDPSDSRPMPSTLDALTQGIGSGLKGVGQTAKLAGGVKTEVGEQSPAAAPYEWRDFTSPSRAVAKTAYQLGHGSPGLAAGIAGAVGGTAAAGPVGGLAGGATGMVLGTALQTVGPAFAEEL